MLQNTVLKNQTIDDNAAKADFDKVLQIHLKRLLGAKANINDAPLNLETITAMIALAERELDYQDNPESISRHTTDSLNHEMFELGIDSQQDASDAVDQLKDKGCVAANEHGILEPAEIVMKMTKTLDRLFPKMPGMLFTAYYVQTLQEVLSGRKGLEHALDQFDQALHMHGALSSPAKQKSGPKPGTEKKSPKRTHKALGDLLKRTAARAKSRESSGPQETQSAQDFSIKEFDSFEIKNLGEPEPEIPEAQVPEKPTKEEEKAAPDNDADQNYVDKDPVKEETKPESSAQKSIEDVVNPKSDAQDLLKEAAQGDLPDQETPILIHPLEKPVDQPAQEKAPDSNAIDRAAPDKNDRPDIGEADIMERVAAMEQALAMACPLCGKGKVTASKTSMGKNFYVCSDKACQFISWGRPHHEACPMCGNSFLVEGAGIEGLLTLKCPRATCNYARPLDGEAPAQVVAPKKSRLVKKRKRRVRRRVVKAR